jgi:hypothetical protein
MVRGVYMVSRQKEDGTFGIKLVWPQFMDDELADCRVGFPTEYDKKYDIPLNSKMSTT